MKNTQEGCCPQCTGFLKGIKLEGQKTVTAKWYSTKCLPEILQEVNAKGLMLQHDNASSHTAGLTIEFLKQEQIKVIEHPPYSPDLAMCRFWLFFNAKKNLHGRRFHSEEEIDVAINTFFLQFQKRNGLRHSIGGKFAYKSALMLEETTLNTPKIL
ncbi:histone-lysine N-methyltransferase SETMAR [Trichonephila clavipes]|nr:histone-lysine N-methyltransferase SETMAR [Trichonephila clavipes]